MYCVIDIGSNTIRLVVYKVENNTIKPIIPTIMIKTDLISHTKETAASNVRFRVINTLFIVSRL